MEQALGKAEEAFRETIAEPPREVELMPLEGAGDIILQTAADIVLEKLRQIRRKQREKGDIRMVEAQYALQTLRVVQRQKEVMAWTSALSGIDAGELKQALQDLKELDKAKKVITLDQQRISAGSDPR